MQKMKRLLSLALIFALALSLAGCFDINQYIPTTQESTGDGLTTYHITVRTHSGQYLKDVGVRVFADKEKTDLVWYDKTDANGKMSFIADTFDGYVVALENIPTGYMKADYYALTGVDNEIVLTIGLQSDVDLNTVELQLGSAMVDMTVTAGAEEYTISKLLAGKKAVVLHFFDGGVADGLACLEEAWLDYADEVAVLALNPVDGDVSVYAEGKKLPVAACDSGWLRALKLTDFPTTVVVDRYGIISLIYSGNLGDADIYRDVFAFFARNDYTAELVENIESIIGKEMQGTLENPYEADGSADISASVPPGGMVYYNIYDVQDMLLQIYSANAWVMYEGQAYYPENGVIALNIDTVDPETPVTLGIGNAGANTELFVARLSFREGTQGNPIPVDLGEHNIHLLEGDERGRFVTYKAVMPGVLRFKCAVDPENPWILAATNRSSGVKISSEKDLLTDEVTGETYMLLDVKANDVVLIWVGTKADKEGIYPAATLNFTFGYEGQGGDQPVDPPAPGKEITFSVTVRDSYGFPLQNVNVVFSDANGDTTVLTGMDGTASYTNRLGGVQVTLYTIPGYTALKNTFHLTESTSNLSVTFTGKMDGEPVHLSFADAYRVNEGDTYVILNGNAQNYFLLTPLGSGLYQFSAEGSLSFWGWDLNSIPEQSFDLIPTDTGFILFVPEEKIGQTCIIGITGVPNTTLHIQQISG